MDIEERLNDLMSRLPYLHKTIGGVKGFRERLRLALNEVARDQRHACADAIMDVERCHGEHCDCKDRSHQAVMNATLTPHAPS